MKVSLLTGGGDKPYAHGLVTALADRGVDVDFIGSDDLLADEIVALKGVRFLNLRGSQDSRASAARKAARVAIYYLRLMRYAATTDAVVFHLLWANRFIVMDRVVLLSYYKLLDKQLVFTAHNIDERRRDGGDSLLNRWTLRILYRMADHVFVHTGKMKVQLGTEFRVPPERISVIPFGINNAVPRSAMTAEQARRRLGVPADARTMLFFGNIAPYKGLEYAIGALDHLVRKDPRFRLLIAGQIKGCTDYWETIRDLITKHGVGGQIMERIEYVDDNDVETFFKASDIVVLPYRFIYQSGVLSLAYSFGVPVVAANVGSLSEDVIEGKTGSTFAPEDPVAMADAVWRFFAGPHFRDVAKNREEIIAFGNERYAWSKVAETTCSVYKNLLGDRRDVVR